MLENKNQIQKKIMVSHIDIADTTTALGGIDTRITQNYQVRLVEKYEMDYGSLQAGG